MRLIHSLRGELLAWLGAPLLLLWGLSVYTHYQSAVHAANQAYDRSLLASARTVAERLVVRNGHIEVDVPWVVLDSFERNMNDQLFYQVISPEGKTLSGYDDLPAIPPASAPSELYPALVHFYDARYRQQRIRVAALWQPVSEEGVNGMALVLVAETLNSRRAFADGLLHPNERQVLYVIAEELGISRVQFEQFLRMMEGGQQFGGDRAWSGASQGGPRYGAQQGPTLEAAYKVLGVKPTDDYMTIKRAWRKLMAEHHPDKLVAKGLPPEMMEMAKQKAQEIQAAWDLIRKERKFK